VETVTAGFTLADELAVLASIPASEAASPVPLALAEVPEPLLSAVAVPSENPFVEAVLPVVSTEPLESASTVAELDAEPSPTDVADTSMLADEDAEALPSVPVLVIELAAAADAVPVMEPPPVVTTSTSPSAADAEIAEMSSDVASVELSAKAWPVAVPVAVDEPATSACAAAPSSVTTAADAAPEADAPAPTVARFAAASAVPASASKVEMLEPSAVASSVVSSPVVGSVPPAAVAPVDTEESAVLPAASSLCAEAPPLAEAVAPAPVPWASECDAVLAEPPPAVEWLSDWALADAANEGVMGDADNTSAKALAESKSPHFK